MARILTLAAAAAMLAACGSDDGRSDNAAGEPAAANDTAAPPAANEAAAVPKATPPPAAGPEPAGAAAIPTPFHGVYDASREACGRPSEYRLTVSARELRFHESIGAVRSVVADGPDAIRINADYQGEGESWSNVQALRLADGGATLTVTGEGTSLTRVRCGSSPG